MKIILDQERCAGHAQCNAAGPDVYPLDERGYCAITAPVEVPAGLEDQARAGAAACPEQAITLADGDE